MRQIRVKFYDTIKKTPSESFVYYFATKEHSHEETFDEMINFQLKLLGRFAPKAVFISEFS